MKFAGCGIIVFLTVFATWASGAGITTNASADMWVSFAPPQPPLFQHDERQGTSFAFAGVGLNEMIAANASATASGTTLDVIARSYNWDNYCNCGSDVRSAAELTLDDMLTLPSSGLRWSADVAVSSLRSRIAGVEVRIGAGYAIWGSNSIGIPDATTITVSGQGPYPWSTSIPIYIHVWANTGTNGSAQGNSVSNIHVELQQIRVFSDVSSDPLTGFTYKSLSGMAYPVFGGTLDSGVPEPGTATFLVVGGLLLLAGRRRMRT